MRRFAPHIGRFDRTPLPWRNVTHNKVALFVSTSAVAFAVIIMFTEVGFLNGLYDSQTQIIESFRADLIMVSRALHIFNTHETFSRVRLQQAEQINGVKAVYPIYVEDTSSLLRNPQTGIRNGVRVIGFDPGNPIFEWRSLQRAALQLNMLRTVAFDKASRSFIGALSPATVTELNDRTVTVTGNFSLGPDYYYDGNILTSSDSLCVIFPQQRRENVFVGLIQLERGVSADRVLEQLRAQSGPDVDILKKSSFVAREKAKWRQATPAGYVFTMGVAVGFIIGIFICYQILYTDISSNLPQLATLKALGYEDREITKLVLQQAAILGLLGFAPALVVTFGLYAVLTAMTGIITQLTAARIVLVLILTLGMCLVAGWLASRRALATDPAELF